MTKELEVVQKDGSVHLVLYDEGDADLVERHTWCVHRARPGAPYYALTNFRWPGGGLMSGSMHILLMGTKGIDHVNHDGLDNRRSNLRVASASQNAANMRTSGRGGSSYRGVSWDSRRRKWRSIIGIGSERIWLGYFEGEVAAAKAYDDRAVATWGEFASLNFGDAK